VFTVALVLLQAPNALFDKVKKQIIVKRTKFTVAKVLVQAPNALFEHLGGKMRGRDLVFSNFRFARLERALHMRVIRSDIAPFRKRLNGPVKNIPKVPLVSCIGLLVVVLAII